MKIIEEQKEEIFKQFINLKYTSNDFINRLNIIQIIKNFGFKYDLYISNISCINVCKHYNISFNVNNTYINEKIFFKYKKEIRKRKLNNILK